MVRSKDKGDSRWRLRFSLRTLFVMMTMLALAVGWWSMLPTLTAKRFIAAIENDQYDEADELFLNPRDGFLSRTSMDHYRSIEVQASLGERRWNRGWPDGRYVYVKVRYRDGKKMGGFARRVVATRNGLEAPVEYFTQPRFGSIANR